jgi:hypothetical protein
MSRPAEGSKNFLCASPARCGTLPRSLPPRPGHLLRFPRFSICRYPCFSRRKHLCNVLLSRLSSYGTTYADGATCRLSQGHCGSIFSWLRPPPQGARGPRRPLRTFFGNDGGNPAAPLLLLHNGTLYGTQPSVVPAAATELSSRSLRNRSCINIGSRLPVLPGSRKPGSRSVNYNP